MLVTERTDLPNLATRAEAAAALRVSVRTIDRMIKREQLSAARLTDRSIRIPVSAIAALAEAGDRP